MKNKIIESQVDDFESAEERVDSDNSADLIITLTPEIRVLVFHAKKEYVLEEFVTRVGRGIGKNGQAPKRAKGEEYGQWAFYGSYGNIQQATKRAAECLVHGRLKAQRIVAIKDYVTEMKTANLDIERILGAIG